MAHLQSRLSVRTVVRRRLLPLRTKTVYSRRNLWLAGLFVIVVFYLAHVWQFREYVNDDAYITFRYSQSLAEGSGPYYNSGQHVEGFTSPLWMLLISVVILLFGSPAAPVAAKLMGMLAGAATVVISFMLTRTMMRQMRTSLLLENPAGLVVAGLVAVNPSFVVNSVSGLETGLYGLLIVAAMYAVVCEWIHADRYGAGVLLALLSICRPEGIIIALLLLATQLWQSHTGPRWIGHIAADGSFVYERRTDHRRLVRRNGCLLLAALVLQFGARFMLYDGELLPNTFWAKQAVWFSDNTWRYLIGGAGSNLLLPIGGLAVLTIMSLVRRHAKLLAPVVVVAGGLFLPLLTGADWMPGYRFLVPYLPAVFVIAGLSLSLLPDQVRMGRLQIAAVAAFGLIPLCWFMQSGDRDDLRTQIQTRARGYQSGHAALAHWLKETGGVIHSVSLMDIGIVGFDCPDLDIIDLTGLTDRGIAHNPGGFLDKQYPPSYLLDQHPDAFVLVFTAPGDPAEAPPEQLSFRLWTPMEKRLYFDTEFRRRYFERVYPAARPVDWRQRVARHLGAERIFVHEFPGHYYLLAVFRRQD